MLDARELLGDSLCFCPSNMLNKNFVYFIIFLKMAINLNPLEQIISSVLTKSLIDEFFLCFESRLNSCSELVRDASWTITRFVNITLSHVRCSVSNHS